MVDRIEARYRDHSEEALEAKFKCQSPGMQRSPGVQILGNELCRV